MIPASSRRLDFYDTMLIIALVSLTVGAPLAYAQVSKHPQADYQSGFKWGVHDAKDKHNTYLFQPGNGFINQTDSFIDGYVIGYCSVAGPNISVDEPEGGFWCKDGPKSANWDVGRTINGNFTSKFPSRNLD